MVAPHVHRSPSDHRFRVHDGEAFIAIYEPDEAHLAEAHLQRILPKRKARPAAPVPRDLVLEVTDAPVRAAGTPQVADVDRVHVQQFSDGFRVWHPDLRTFVAGPDGAYQRREDALARARDVMVQIGTAARAKKPARRATPAPSEGLFAPRELAARGEQIGFKFNGADEESRAVRALTRLAQAVVEEPGAFDADLAHYARTHNLQELVNTIAYSEANALRDTADRGGYTHWAGGYGPFNGAVRGRAVLSLRHALERKGNGAQQPWGRRYMAPQLGTYEDLLPMGRAPSADEVRARPRRQTVADYERQSELKPNGAHSFTPAVVDSKTVTYRVRGAQFRRRFLLVSGPFEARAWVEVSPHSLMVGFVEKPSATAEVHDRDLNDDPLAVVTEGMALRAVGAYRARRPGGSAW